MFLNFAPNFLRKRNIFEKDFEKILFRIYTRKIIKSTMSFYSDIIAATVRKPSHVDVEKLMAFGRYIASCLPKYIQQIQLTAGDELELHIVPDGIIPIFTFLKDHHNTQFVNLSDITALDVPSREFRFEVYIHTDNIN